MSLILNKKLVGVIGICLPVFLANCAPQDKVAMLERRIDGLVLENASLNKKINAMQSEQAMTLKSGQADLYNRVEQVEAEILRLNGLIEQIEYRNKQDKQEVLRFASEVKEQIDKINERNKMMNEAMAPVGPEIPDDGRKATAPVQTSAPVVAPPAPAPAKEVNPYDRGVELYKQKDFKEAKRSFQAYIDKNPNGDKLDSAYFWLGDCEFGMGRYEEAILEYQKVITKFPKSNKAPAALLKQAMSFEKLGDKQSAKILYEKLLKQYPKSEQAPVAQKELAKFK
jgi:tol-pal system protein YbgF